MGTPYASRGGRTDRGNDRATARPVIPRTVTRPVTTNQVRGASPLRRGAGPSTTNQTGKGAGCSSSTVGRRRPRPSSTPPWSVPIVRTPRRTATPPGCRSCRTFLARVRPGGLLLTAALRHCDGYLVGGKMFPGAGVDERDVRRALEIAFGPLVGAVEVRELTAQPEHGYSGIVLGWARRPGPAATSDVLPMSDGAGSPVASAGEVTSRR
jgi:hypothetical protein